MLQLYPAYLLCNRRKTLTGLPDPMYMQPTNKPCSCQEFIHTSWYYYKAVILMSGAVLSWGFHSGAMVYWGFHPSAVLSWGVPSWGGAVLGGSILGWCCPGGFHPGVVLSWGVPSWGGAVLGLNLPPLV